MRAIAWLLRVFCYSFHTILCLVLIALGVVAVRSNVSDMKIETLPWHGTELNHRLIGLGVVGLLTVALAITGKLRFLLALWSIYVLAILLSGVFFNSTVTFAGREDFDQWLWLIAGAAVAFVGSLSMPSARWR
jgi:hypothetical protein